MLLLAIIVGGMAIGWLVQLVLGRDTRQVDWVLALASGLIGSFVGGLLFSLIAGDGLALQPSGLIGTFVGAVVVTLVWQAVDKNRRAKQRAAR